MRDILSVTTLIRYKVCDVCMHVYVHRYELWKPHLRSMMESDMKAVSVGTKRKAEVLEACLQQMKACFIDVS